MITTKEFYETIGMEADTHVEVIYPKPSKEELRMIKECEQHQKELFARHKERK